MQRAPILVGLSLVAAGLAWPWPARLPPGRLPGDIHLEREGFSCRVPLMAGRVVSLLVGLLPWLCRR